MKNTERDATGRPIKLSVCPRWQTVRGLFGRGSKFAACWIAFQWVSCPASRYRSVFEDSLQDVKRADQISLRRTHPSPGGSTSAGAAPLQTRPPRWACAGRCLHTASRSNCSPACTCGRSAAPYSRPADRQREGEHEDLLFVFGPSHEKKNPFSRFNSNTPDTVSAGR